MKLRVKKTGSVIRVSEGVWETLRNKGNDHLYEVVDPVPQPEIKSVPKRKPRKIQIEDLSVETQNDE